jgi:broad specificity phosphatase PhoE
VTEAVLRLILVRHGVTSWNREQRMQGHTDVELDAEGHVQAAAMAERLSKSEYVIQAVYSSDLKRARQTAEAIAAPLSLPVRSTVLLREMMLGDWEGLTADDIIARGDEQQLSLYRADSYTNRPPLAEPLVQVRNRMVCALDLIRAEQQSGTVVVVGHGGSLRALLCEALNAPTSCMRHFSLSNTGMSVIEETGPYEKRAMRVVSMNDTSHLSVGRG